MALGALDSMISIIVPIYNVEKYLKPCVESILNSTYQDFELILVDDGSTDNSGSICDRFAEQNSCVRVIHQPNDGVSSARNSGMKAATGEYIMFIDGDDIIHSRMIEVLYTAINTGDYDFSMVYAKDLPDSEHDSNLLVEEIDDAKSIILSQKDYFEKLFTTSLQYHLVCNKLYKSSLISGLAFNKTGAEDLEWNNRMCLRMNQAILIEAELYNYIQRASSEMHSGVTRAFVDRINSVALCLNDIPVENKYYRALCLKFLYTMIQYVRYSSRKSALCEVARSNAKNAVKKVRRELKASPFISWGRKFRIMFNYHFPMVSNTVQDMIIKYRR